jgi:hypothetical protein
VSQQDLNWASAPETDGMTSDQERELLNAVAELLVEAKRKAREVDGAPNE